MNQKTLLGLIAIAVIVIVAAIWIHQANQPISETAETAHKLVPDLEAHVNDIDKVVFTGAGSKPIATITRSDHGWSIAEKDGYPADTGKLREFVLKLASATVLEKKTSDKGKYGELGVRDVSDKDAKGVEVELDGGGKPVKLIVGVPDSRASGTFVRRVGDAQSLLVSGRLSADKKTSDWLRKSLVDIPEKRIADVTITHPDGKVVHVHKNAEGDANFSLADVPKGREPGAQYTINGVSSTLGGLRFDDVLPAKDAMPDDKAVKARYETFDGLVVDVTAWNDKGTDYAQFKATLDSDRADQHIDAEQADAKAKASAATSADNKASTEDGTSGTPATHDANAAAGEVASAKPLAVTDPAKDRANRLVGLNKEIADLNKRFDGWTYVLPSYKYADIDKSEEDLLKAPEAKATPAKNKASGATRAKAHAAKPRKSHVH